MGTSKTPEYKADRQPVALIAGPTASGKSDLAVRLAHGLQDAGRNAAIINADSAQVYRDLAVVSARPSAQDMGGVDHLLFGRWDAEQPCSGADWARAAKGEITRLHADGTIPILVGGTGMYLKILLEGIADIPEIELAIREQVRALDTPTAWAALQVEDPERAERLDAGDSQRITRALEVVRSTGKPLAAWQKSKTGGIEDDVAVHPLLLMPEREILYQRCDQRFEWMLENGAISEVQRLVDRCLPRELPIMRAIGVPEIVAFLDGQITQAEMVAFGQQATRNYAKRQFTWFRRQTPMEWRREEDFDCDLMALIDGILQN